jgi:hypothetical protein
MVSDNGGEHWRERDLAATADASDHPRVLVHGGGFCVFWNTRRELLTTVAIK